MALSPVLLVLFCHCTGRDRPQGKRVDPSLIDPLAQLLNHTHPNTSLHFDVSVLAGSLSQPVLSQPPSLSTSPGTTASLTRTLSRDICVGSKYMYWYQQKPGSPPQFFLYFYTDSDKELGPGVPSRVSGSKDASTDMASLLITDLQPEDEADYYCSVGYSSGSSFCYPQCLRQ